MPLVAFTTFAILRAPVGDPQVQGFFDRLPDTFAAADRFEGFVGRRSRQPTDPRFDWGETDRTRFFDPAVHGGAVQTLSLWCTLESVAAFAYSGVHGEAMRHRREWFLEPAWPSYAAWWVGDGHVPDWREARERLEALHDRGASPSSFDFRTPFGPDGDPVTLDRDVVREIVARARAMAPGEPGRDSERDQIVRVLAAERERADRGSAVARQSDEDAGSRL